MGTSPSPKHLRSDSHTRPKRSGDSLTAPTPYGVGFMMRHLLTRTFIPSGGLFACLTGSTTRASLLYPAGCSECIDAARLRHARSRATRPYPSFRMESTSSWAAAIMSSPSRIVNDSVISRLSNAFSVGTSPRSAWYARPYTLALAGSRPRA